MASRLKTVEKPIHIAGLDLIRFMAALMVMVYHLFYWRNGHTPPDATSVENIWWFGWVGVQVFFVLSGFVIAFSAGGGSPWRFARKRVLRLAPTVWICATITLVAFSAIGANAGLSLLPEYVRAITFFPAGKSIDVVYWTLEVEVSFYILVFALLWFTGVSALTPVMIGVGLVSAAFNGLLALDQAALLPHAIAPAIEAIRRSNTARLLLIHHGVYFALGVVLWAAAQPTATWKVKAAAWFFAVFATLCVLWSAQEYIVIHHAQGVPLLLVPLVWAVLLSAMVSFIFLGSGVFAAPNLAPTVRFLGLMTFPVYLLHNNLGFVARDALRRMGAHHGATLTAIAVVLTVSALVVQWLEPMLRKDLDNALRTTKPLLPRPRREI